MQLKRDVLPALQKRNAKLLIVGIGSFDSAQTFAERTGFPAELMLVDSSEESEAYGAVGTRNSQFVDGKQKFEGIGSMWSKATNAAIDKRGKDDLNAILKLYKPLQPKKIEQTLVQGGSFVFDGTRTLLEHYDESSGAHIELETILAAALR